MVSSWDSYYILFLSAILALGIPGILAIISFVFFKKNHSKIQAHRKTPGDSFGMGSSLEDRKAAQLQKELGLKANRTILGQTINVRFFLAANASLVLMTLGLAMIPCTTTLQAENHEGLMNGIISIITLVGFAALGLLYSIRKGDMGWVSTYQGGKSKSPRSGKED